MTKEQIKQLEKTLKPCPWCGYKEPIIYKRETGTKLQPVLYGIHCPRYACPKEYMLLYDDIHKAIKVWNKWPRDKKGADL